jgi:hypothetical protein
MALNRLLVAVLASCFIITRTSGDVSNTAEHLLSGIPKGTCLDYRKSGEYWSFRWCHERNVSGDLQPFRSCCSSLKICNSPPPSTLCTTTGDAVSGPLPSAAHG